MLNHAIQLDALAAELPEAKGRRWPHSDILQPVFQLQKISDYGTSTPAVARTVLQGSDILQHFNVEPAKRTEALLTLQELQRHLLRCVAIVDNLTADVKAASDQVKRDGLLLHAEGRAVTLPAVTDVQSKAESFLQSAKLAIAQTGKLTTPFFGVAHDHRYHKVIDWASKEFGPGDVFTQVIKSWEPWVKSVVTMRNAVDHPSQGPGGMLVTRDFALRSAKPPELDDPAWCLTGEPMRPIVSEMSSITEGIIELGEDMLASLFVKLKFSFPLAIYEIPIEQRDPNCPKRLRVGLAASMKL